MSEPHCAVRVAAGIAAILPCVATAVDGERGAQVYAEQCLVCHQAEGAGLPPVYPSLRDSALVRGSGAEVVRVVAEGRAAMPAFGLTLAPDDVLAVVVHIRNLAGVSDAPGSLQAPAQVTTSGNRNDDL
jgi:cytochrome c oxidase subunit 2